MAKSKSRNKAQTQQQAAAAARRRDAARRARTKAAAIIGVFALFLLGFAGVLAKNNSSSSASSTPCPAADGSSDQMLTFPSAPKMCIKKNKTYTATFDTNQGNIVVALDTKNTPKTVNNFVFLSLYHYYDATQIFRTDTSIDIIQGGSPHTEDASDVGPGYTIKDEGSGYKYSAGDLVMARSQAANSAGAQYFFVTGPAASALNAAGTYVTFGHTTQGLDVLQKIIGMNVDNPTSGLGGKPSQPVTVNSVKIAAS